MTTLPPKKKRPTIAKMMTEAKRLPEKDPYVCSHEVGAITSLLLKKGLTHKEIAAWFDERGYHWGVQGLMNGWRHWKKLKKITR